MGLKIESKESKKPLNRLLPAIIMVMTLGLAPFNPPHILGKVKWVMGGAKGMQPMDWFDLLLHGLPWVFLLFTIVQIIYRYAIKNNPR